MVEKERWVEQGGMGRVSWSERVEGRGGKEVERRVGLLIGEGEREGGFEQE